MEAKRGKMSMSLKQVIIELYLTGEKVFVMARTINRSLESFYKFVRISESFGSLENLSRPGRHRSIENREYRMLQRIVNRDRRAPLK